MKRIALFGLIVLAGCQESAAPTGTNGSFVGSSSVVPAGPTATNGEASRSNVPAQGAVDKNGEASDGASPPPQPWPFKDPEKLAVITLTRILNGSKPILYVVHDEDGDWQFLDGDDVSEEDAETVAFKRVVDLDRSLGELADLPVNWTAEREAVGKPWTRAPRQ